MGHVAKDGRRETARINSQEFKQWKEEGHARGEGRGMIRGDMGDGVFMQMSARTIFLVVTDAHVQ